jgi:hypothetical protein
MWGTEKLDRRGVDNNINKANKKEKLSFILLQVIVYTYSSSRQEICPLLLIQIKVCTPWEPCYDGRFYLKPLKGYHNLFLKDKVVATHAY